MTSVHLKHTAFADILNHFRADANPPLTDEEVESLASRLSAPDNRGKYKQVYAEFLKERGKTDSHIPPNFKAT